MQPARCASVDAGMIPSSASEQQAAFIQGFRSLQISTRSSMRIVSKLSGATSNVDTGCGRTCCFPPCRPRPVDETSIPTGEVRSVSGAMDLRQKTRIGDLAEGEG